MSRKIVISYLVLFVLRFLLSCICDCPRPKPIKLTFDRLETIMFIRPDLEAREIGYQLTLTDTSKIQYVSAKFSWFNTALACSCSDPFYGEAASRLKEIKIITTNNFSSTIPANTDVSNLFVGAYDRYHTTHNQLLDTLPRLAANFTNQNFELSGYTKKDLFLYLKEKPDNLSVKFKIQLIFEDGQVLETNT